MKLSVSLATFFFGFVYFFISSSVLIALFAFPVLFDERCNLFVHCCYIVSVERLFCAAWPLLKLWLHLDRANRLEQSI